MFIGRQYELGLIRRQLADRSKAQLIILYGRRRVGMSTLIREAVKKQPNVLFLKGLKGNKLELK
jgi:AAA+ ATPase superfamily predicted ATPase